MMTCAVLVLVAVFTLLTGCPGSNCGPEIGACHSGCDHVLLSGEGRASSCALRVSCAGPVVWPSLLFVVSSPLSVKEKILARVVGRYPGVMLLPWPSPMVTSRHTASLQQVPEFKTHTATLQPTRLRLFMDP